jgi:hypothetical protein
LALVIALIQTGTEDSASKLNSLWSFLCIVSLALFSLLVFRRLFKRFIQKAFENNIAVYKNLAMTITFCTLFTYAYTTDIIGVHAVFGGFLFGICIPRGEFAENLTSKIEEFTVQILLPLYFTFSGLRTNISSLNEGKLWGMFFLLLLLAASGKILGAMLTARMFGHTWRESAAVGFLMNAKGLVELIVLNIGLDAGVIETDVFTMMVLVALVTTFMAKPCTNLVYPERLRGKKKLEEEQGIELPIIFEMSPDPLDMDKKHEFDEKLALSFAFPVISPNDILNGTDLFKFLVSYEKKFGMGIIRFQQAQENPMLQNLNAAYNILEHDVVLERFASYATIARVDLRCKLVVSSSIEFASELVSFAERLKVDMVTLPVQRNEVLLEEHAEVSYGYGDVYCTQILKVLSLSRSIPVAMYCGSSKRSNIGKQLRIGVLCSSSDAKINGLAVKVFSNMLARPEAEGFRIQVESQHEVKYDEQTENVLNSISNAKVVTCKEENLIEEVTSMHLDLIISGDSKHTAPKVTSSAFDFLGLLAGVKLMNPNISALMIYGDSDD